MMVKASASKFEGASEVQPQIRKLQEEFVSLTAGFLVVISRALILTRMLLLVLHLQILVQFMVIYQRVLTAKP